jgi:hypothetical protein
MVASLYYQVKRVQKVLHQLISKIFSKLETVKKIL